MKTTYLSIKEYAKKNGVSQQTIRNQMDSGVLQAKKAGRKTKWKIKEEDKFQEEVNRRILLATDENKGLTRQEAERIIKQEDAIRRQRENLLAENELIRLDFVKEHITACMSNLYASTLESLLETIDSISLSYSIPVEPVKKKLLETLKAKWDKLKAEMDGFATKSSD